MKVVKILLFLIIVITSKLSFAGAYCTDEKITSLTMSGDSVYFTTDKSCSQWCKINPDWSEAAINRAYSMLMTAQSSDKGVRFYWNEHSVSCESVLPVYAMPGILSIL